MHSLISYNEIFLSFDENEQDSLMYDVLHKEKPTCDYFNCFKIIVCDHVWLLCSHESASPIRQPYMLIGYTPKPCEARLFIFVYTSLDTKRINESKEAEWLKSDILVMLFLRLVPRSFHQWQSVPNNWSD